MKPSRLVVIFAVLALLSCARQPSLKTLAGEWRQDSDYFQTKNIIGQLGEIENFEDYEIFIAGNQIAITRLVGKEPDEKRVYWESPLLFDTDAADHRQITFKTQDGQNVTASVFFERDRLILKVGERKLAFIRNKATNLRIKGYVRQS